VRIPFPERIPIEGAGLFAAALFAIQSVERTPFYFSVGCFAFVMIATFAFNTAGGLTRPSGAYVFFYSTLVVVLGLCCKAVLWEPADSNLRDPHTTILVYVAGISAMFATVLVSRRITRRTGLLENLLKDRDMYRATVGCIVFGIGAPVFLGLLGSAGERLTTAFAQLNELLPVAIILGVIYEIRKSGGTRSINVPVLCAAAFFFIQGVLGFSKQGMFTPVVAWAIPVAALQYRLSRAQIVGAAIMLYLAFNFLVPYAQYGRGQVNSDTSFNERINTAIHYFTNPTETRRLYSELSDEEAQQETVHYYDKPQGFFDRLQFISTDDALIDISKPGKEFGLIPLQMAFLNTVPHVFWPDKPEINFGNVYAHQIGGMPEDDTTTGISFSPTAEAFHLARWVGVLVWAPAIWLLLFVVYDSLCGDTRNSVWGLLVVILVSHFAPEGALSGAIYFITFGSVAVVFCAFFAAYVAPMFSVVVLGPDRRDADAATYVPGGRRAPAATTPRTGR
jgi:hypothetical protein